MSYKSVFYIILATIVCAHYAAVAATSATAPTGRGRGSTTPASLSSAMREMGSMLTTIKNEAGDPAKIEQTLKDITTFERDVAISKLQAPPYVNRLATAEEQAKALESYRVEMNVLTRALLDLEDAVAAKKADDIKKSLDTLAQIEKQGHTEFHVGGGG